jgi:Lon protease-like protein
MAGRIVAEKVCEKYLAALVIVQDGEVGRGHNGRIMRIPLFPLNLVLFPGAALPLHIFEDRYKEMVAECLEKKKSFGVVHADGEQMSIVGCTARIVRVVQRYDDGRTDILCEGERRFEIEGLDESRRFLQADVEFFEDEGAGSTRDDREDCAALHFATLHMAGVEAPTIHLDLNAPVAFQLADALPSDAGLKQQLLASRSDADRTKKLRDFYNDLLPRLRAKEDANRAGQSSFPIH